MKKIKKVFRALSALIVASFSKIGGLISRAYNMLDERDLIQPAYGIKEPVKQNRVGIALLGLGRIIIIVVLFILGIKVLFDKKKSKEKKYISIMILILIGIIVILIFNFLIYAIDGL